MKQLRALLLALFATLAFVAVPATSNAAQYNFSWPAYNWAGTHWQNVSFINSDSTVFVNWAGAGAGAQAHWTSPSLGSNGLTFTNVNYNVYGWMDSVTSADFRLCWRDQLVVAPYNGCGSAAVRSHGAGTNFAGWTGFNVAGSSPNYGGYTAFSANIYATAEGSDTSMQFQGYSGTIDDPTAPATANNGTAATGGWIRQNFIGNASAHDHGQSGVKRQAAIVNGQEVAVVNRSCNYNAGFVPCTNSYSSWNPTIDVAHNAFVQGSNTFRYSASDGADQVGYSSQTTVKVDTVDPASPIDPQGSGNGLEGYSSDNSFDFSWGNGSETTETSTQSGLSHVVIDLSPTDPEKTDPAPIVIPVGGSNGSALATLDSVTGLELPEESVTYRYGIGLRDLAGNWSDNVAVDGSGNPTGVTPEDGLDVTFSDNVPPPPQLNANGWVSEPELLSGYSQEWNVVFLLGDTPICGYAASVTPTSSDPGNTINVTGDVRDWELPSDLTEGTHQVNIKSIGCNLLPASAYASTDVKVDRTDPIPSVSGVTAGKWYKDGSVVNISGSDALSGMQAATPAQDYNEGAYITTSLNGDTDAYTKGGSANIPVTGEGPKSLRYSATDLAGNSSDVSTVDFGIDASNPTGYLEHPDAATPTVIAAPLADVVSGLDGAQIDVQRVSGGDWLTLPTGLAGLSGEAVGGYPNSARALTRFPDTTLPEDKYRVRVRTKDQAGNPLVTDRDRNGNPLIVDSANMRAYSGLSAMLFKAKRTCKKKRGVRGVRCVKRARGKVVFLGGSANLNVAYKRGAVVQGFLVDAQTKALGRQPIEIYTKAAGKSEILAGTTSTRADGSYVFKLKPGVSRDVRVYYPGTETRRDTSAAVKLGTGAKLNLRVSKKRALTGQTVVFRGTVTSFDRAVPAAGKIVALQFYAGKKWRPAVAIARTDSKGRFSVKYKFDGKRVKARIVFRVIAPSEENWGHSTSASRPVTMKLN